MESWIASAGATGREGFTLVELLVVIASSASWPPLRFRRRWHHRSWQEAACDGTGSAATLRTASETFRCRDPQGDPASSLARPRARRIHRLDDLEISGNVNDGQRSGHHRRRHGHFCRTGLNEDCCRDVVGWGAQRSRMERRPRRRALVGAPPGHGDGTNDERTWTRRHGRSGERGFGLVDPARGRPVMSSAWRRRRLRRRRRVVAGQGERDADADKRSIPRPSARSRQGRRPMAPDPTEAELVTLACSTVHDP